MSFNYIELFSLFRFCFAHTLTQLTANVLCHNHNHDHQQHHNHHSHAHVHAHPQNSRNNSVSQADYNKLPKNPQAPNGGGPVPMNGSATPSSNGSGPFKPVPPPKPKNYRPPVQSGGSSGSGGTTPWENGVSEWE